MVSIKIARLCSAKFLKPRPQIAQIVRSTHARTALFQIYVTITFAAIVDVSVRS